MKRSNRAFPGNEFDAGVIQISERNSGNARKKCKARLIDVLLRTSLSDPWFTFEGGEFGDTFGRQSEDFKSAGAFLVRG